MKKTERIIQCAHCGNETVHGLLYVAKTVQQAYSAIDEEETIDYEISYYLTRCKTCKGISLFADDEFDDIQGDISKATLCYPKQKKFGDEIPELILKTYLEAKRIQQISSTAFAVMIRRSLEYLCKHQKAKGHTLKNQLDDLALKGIIPANLAAMGETLRELGNVGAHASSYKIDRTEVRAMDDFFIAMLEYVYVGPSKLQKLKESIKKKKGTTG